MHASEILQCRCRSVVTSRSLKNKTFPFCVVTASLVTQCYCKQLLFKHDETTCANFQLGLSRLVLTYSLTNCLRSVRYDWIHDAAVPDTPNSVCSRCISVCMMTNCIEGCGQVEADQHCDLLLGGRENTLSKALSTLLQKSATVAENGETTAKFGDCRTFLRQSHFSATNCRTFLRQCGQALRRRAERSQCSDLVCRQTGTG